MTFAAIADELGVDEATVRRIVASVLAKLRAGLDCHDPDVLVAVLELVLAERRAKILSSEEPGFSRVPRRFSGTRGESAKHAPRSSTVSCNPSPGPKSPGLLEGLPTRFARKP